MTMTMFWIYRRTLKALVPWCWRGSLNIGHGALRLHHRRVQAAHFLEDGHGAIRSSTTAGGRGQKQHCGCVLAYLHALDVLLEEVELFLQLFQLLQPRVGEKKQRKLLTIENRVIMKRYQQELERKGGGVNDTSRLFLRASFRNSMSICLWAAWDSWWWQTSWRAWSQTLTGYHLHYTHLDSGSQTSFLLNSQMSQIRKSKIFWIFFQHYMGKITLQE